jgi:hypothetical protein
MQQIKAPNTCQHSMSQEISEMYWRLLAVESGNVIDVGSGRGGFGLSKPSDVLLYGLERDESIARDCVNYTDIQIGDIEDIDKELFGDIKFNGIFARDILEHLNKPWILLDKLAAQSLPGARIICSVPKANPKIVWNDYTHVRGFTKTSLKALLENSGFAVERIFPMSGYNVATQLGVASFLPNIARIPFLNNFMISWHAIGRKI